MTMMQNCELVDLALQVIERQIHLYINGEDKLESEDEVDLKIKRFNVLYAQSNPVPPYINFDGCGDKGIPYLVKYFTSFDPVNAVGPFSQWTKYDITPTELETSHVHRYLIAEEFNENLLCTSIFDRVVHAIFSYLLAWSNEGLLAFGNKYKQLKHLILLIVLEKDRAPVYMVKGEDIPFIRSSFRLLTKFFRGNKGPSAIMNQSGFSVKKCIPNELVDHFKDVYFKLLNDSLSLEDIRRIESCMKSPFTKIALQFSGRFNEVNFQSKVVTGQSCCGKTTLLEKLKVYGWKVCSRGFLGTFSGKCKSAAEVAGLHAALENALRRGDVLGDRGAIDNPLWSVIMPLCDPKYKDRVVEEIIDHFNGTINEHVIAYMFNQQVVVFVDPYPDMNRKRMMTRCAGGDAFRSRIHMYPITQFIAYYIAARLFGWFIRCVPYDNYGNFESQRYSNIADEIVGLFGKPLPQEELIMASKPTGYHMDDKEYSIATGIFK